MLYKKRDSYFIFILLTIGLGLVSRKISLLPYAVGDVLYAVMMYWICRYIWMKRSPNVTLGFAICLCFLIEFLQLVHHPYLVWVREHPLLRLVFGQGFLYTDLLAYIIGVFTAYVIDNKLIINKKSA